MGVFVGPYADIWMRRKNRIAFIEFKRLLKRHIVICVFDTSRAVHCSSQTEIFQNFDIRKTRKGRRVVVSRTFLARTFRRHKVTEGMRYVNGAKQRQKQRSIINKRDRLRRIVTGRPSTTHVPRNL